MRKIEPRQLVDLTDVGFERHPHHHGNGEWRQKIVSAHHQATSRSQDSTQLPQRQPLIREMHQDARADHSVKATLLERKLSRIGAASRSLSGQSLPPPLEHRFAAVNPLQLDLRSVNKGT